MNADASQAPLSLGWFLICAVPALIVCTVVWLFSGLEKVDRALADLPTDDEPAFDPGCTDPCCNCELGRARYDGYARLAAALEQENAWIESLRSVARADAEAVQR